MIYIYEWDNKYLSALQLCVVKFKLFIYLIYLRNVCLKEILNKVLNPSFGCLSALGDLSVGTCGK